MQTNNTLHSKTAYDANFLFDDGNTYTTVGDNVTKVSAAVKSFDLNALFGESKGIMKNLVLNLVLLALDISSADETYKIRIDESSDSGFATIERQTTFAIDKTVVVPSATDPYLLSLQIAPPKERYLRVVIVAGGTTPSAQTSKGWLSVE